jgi:hypothetical protein
MRVHSPPYLYTRFDNLRLLQVPLEDMINVQKNWFWSCILYFGLLLIKLSEWMMMPYQVHNALSPSFSNWLVLLVRQTPHKQTFIFFLQKGSTKVQNCLQIFGVIEALKQKLGWNVRRIRFVLFVLQSRQCFNRLYFLFSMRDKAHVHYFFLLLLSKVYHE